MVTPAVKREAVAHLKAHLGLSERRACQIAGADRKMVRYQSQRAPDTALRGRLLHRERGFDGVLGGEAGGSRPDLTLKPFLSIIAALLTRSKPASLASRAVRSPTAKTGRCRY